MTEKRLLNLEPLDRRCTGPMSADEHCGAPATLICTDASRLQWFACELHKEDDHGASGVRGAVVHAEPIEQWLERNGLLP